MSENNKILKRADLLVPKIEEPIQKRPSILPRHSRFRRGTLQNKNLDELDFSDVNTFNYLIEILSHSYKSETDLLIIKLYLHTLSNLINYFKTSTEHYEEIIVKISQQLKYQFLLTNKLLFRYGQKGDTFYITLKGKIAVLKPTEETIQLSEEEYMRFIIKLKANDEHELVAKIINANKLIFPLDENIELWFNDETRKTFKRNTVRKSLAAELENTIKLLSLRKSIANLEDDDYYFTVDEYIKNNSPELIETKGERKYVTIWIYYHIHTLSTGQFFGEGALEIASQKRNATLLILEDTHLGYLNKSFYEESIRYLEDMNKKSQVNFLSSFNIFSKISRTDFKRFKYSFSQFTKTRGEKIVNEGDISENIFFLKEGEFEVSTKRSTVDLIKLINYLSGEEDNPVEDYELKDNPELYKFLCEKKFTKITIIKDKDIIGFDDFVYDSKYGFTVEVVSNKAEILQLNKKLLLMFSKDSIIPRKLDEFVIKKKNLLVERLNLIKNNRIQRYENYNNNFNTIEVESELYYNNPRQSNRQKDINSFRDMANESNIMEVSLKNGFNKLILSPIKKTDNKIRLPTLTIRLPRETDMNIRKYSNTKVEEVEKKENNDPFLGKINKKIKNTANIIKNTDKIVSDSRLDNNKLLVTSNSGKLAVIDYNLVIDNYNTKNQVIKLSKKNSATINTEEQNDKILQSLCKIINVKEIRSSRMKASRNILSKNILSKSQRDILKQRESILKNIKSTKTTIQATIN